MAVDKIAVAGLVVGIVGGLAGIVGAVAAVLAAKYAKGSATQVGLEDVERNTAQATEQMTAVRNHMAQLDEHFSIQRSREALDAIARAVSIVFQGEGWNDEDQYFSITVDEPGVAVSHLDLINKNELLTGTVPCKETATGLYAAIIRPTMYAKWRNTGEALPGGERMIVYLRVGLIIDQAKRTRVLSAVSTMEFRARPGVTTVYYVTAGRV